MFQIHKLRKFLVLERDWDEAGNSYSNWETWCKLFCKIGDRPAPVSRRKGHWCTRWTFPGIPGLVLPA